ncbi:hypothetical protein [Flavobacterium sp.]|uniref:hypothetical protein n=1 Tax=Flavobacterium sp. TaxID=239 RepID=UPI0040479F37
MSNTPNININIRNLLIDHLGFTDAGLINNETLIKNGSDFMREDFIKLIITVKRSVDLKKIDSPSGYFIGALKNTLKSKGLYNGK